MSETSNLKGKIIDFALNEMFAVVATKLGNAYLDINDALDYRLQIGDDIEVTEASWYLSDGHIVTVLGYEYRLNGNLIVISK
jgi:hypothetical protein